MKNLYCPVCGTPLEFQDGFWYCKKGKESLSAHVFQEIATAINEIYKQKWCGDKSILGRKDGFCPRCNEETYVISKGQRLCVTCSLVLPSRVFYMLREYHSHLG